MSDNPKKMTAVAELRAALRAELEHACAVMTKDGICMSAYDIIRKCAAVARNKWPRGSAHTYASENADRYRALEDASEAIANDIESALDPQEERKERGDDE